MNLMQRFLRAVRKAQPVPQPVKQPFTRPSAAEVTATLRMLCVEIGNALNEVDLLIAGQKLKDYTDSHAIDYKRLPEFNALSARIDYRIAEYHNGNVKLRRR